MPTHLYSVTGAPVCHYSKLSWQPLNDEFGKSSLLSCTNRQLSESEVFCVLFRIIAFMIKYFITGFLLCQEIFSKRKDFFKKRIDIQNSKCYNRYIKCKDQKPVGRKEPGESCRLVRDNGGVLHEFILLAVR